VKELKNHVIFCILNGIFKINYYSADMCTKADKVLWYSHGRRGVGGAFKFHILSVMATHFKWENKEICGRF
jgi:hypothetical protein